VHSTHCEPAPTYLRPSITVASSVQKIRKSEQERERVHKSEHEKRSIQKWTDEEKREFLKHFAVSMLRTS
jgi:hypothetical protein